MASVLSGFYIRILAEIRQRSGLLCRLLLLLLVWLQLLLLLVLLLLLFTKHSFVGAASPGRSAVGVVAPRRDLGETSTSIRSGAWKRGVRCCANVKRRLDLENTAGIRVLWGSTDAQKALLHAARFGHSTATQPLTGVWSRHLGRPRLPHG